MFLLDLALESLIWTNIWIFLYTKVLFILNTLFPSHIDRSFLWVQSEPEPFEISLYIIISLIVLLMIYISHKLVKNIPKISLKIKIPIFIILSLLFLFSLGAYPQALQFDPYLPRPDQSIYTKISLLYVFAVFIFISVVTAISKFIKNNRLSTVLIYGFVIIIISLVTFDARFPMAGHDYEYFIGPATEVINGKTIYTDVLSRYAFLTIDLFAFLNKLIHFSLFYIPLIVWIFYIIQYFLCFYFLKKVSRSVMFSTVGLASIITVNYFSLSHLPSVIPQVGPLRWLPLIIAVFLLYLFKRINSKYFILSISLLSFFMIDVGIALIMPFLSTIGILFLIKKLGLKDTLKSVLFLAISLISVYLVINAVHLLFGYKVVDIVSPLYSFRKHAVLGLSMIPIAMQTYFWFVILIYFASIIYIFKKQKEFKIDSGRASLARMTSFWGGTKVTTPESLFAMNLILVLFSANLSLFACVYFVGRSHPHNLFNIALFPLLNFFLLAGLIYTSVRSQKKRIIACLLIFIIFIIYPVNQRRFTLTEMIMTKINSLKSPNLFKSDVEEIINKTYTSDIKLINKELKDEKIVVLSVDDTYIFYASGRKDLLDANPIMGIDLPEDLTFAVKNAVKICPKKIVVDCSIVGKCQPYTPFIGVTFNLNMILSLIEKSCKTKYVPSTCTSRLCVASQQPNFH